MASTQPAPHYTALQSPGPAVAAVCLHCGQYWATDAAPEPRPEFWTSCAICQGLGPSLGLARPQDFEARGGLLVQGKDAEIRTLFAFLRSPEALKGFSAWAAQHVYLADACLPEVLQGVLLEDAAELLERFVGGAPLDQAVLGALKTLRGGVKGDIRRTRGVNAQGGPTEKWRDALWPHWKYRVSVDLQTFYRRDVVKDGVTYRLELVPVGGTWSCRVDGDPHRAVATPEDGFRWAADWLDGVGP